MRRFSVALGLVLGCGGGPPGQDSSAQGSEEGGSEDAGGSESTDDAPADAESADGSEGTDGDDTGGDDGGSSESGDPPDPPEPIEWEPCPFYTGGAGLEAECHTFGVPLSYADPDGEAIDLFVKRLGGGDGDVQLVMLFGGPGGSGVGFEDDAESLLADMPNLDILLIDHRGTGRSSPLGTRDGAQAMWGDGLSEFTTSNAARDVAWLIDRTADPAKTSHIYGASYGSYWAHRYLQLFPDQADGVTLMGIAAPGFSFNNWEGDFNAAGLEFLATCDDDPVCSARLGPSAVDRAFSILVDVAQGHCAQAGVDVDAVRAFLATRIAWYWEERALIPALLHRLERCNAADVAAIQAAAPQINNATPGSFEAPAFDVVLAAHIRFSELQDTPIPSDAELTAVHQSSIFTLGSLAGMAAAHAAWPRYTPDEYDGAFAETDTPMLMLHGEFDPNAPLSQALSMAEQFNGEHQHFVMIPAGIHALPSPYPGGASCMQDLLIDFLHDPMAPIDDCSGDVFAPDFDDDSVAPGFFGVPDLWD